MTLTLQKRRLLWFVGGSARSCPDVRVDVVLLDPDSGAWVAKGRRSTGKLRRQPMQARVVGPADQPPMIISSNIEK